MLRLKSFNATKKYNNITGNTTTNKMNRINRTEPKSFSSFLVGTFNFSVVGVRRLHYGAHLRHFL